MDTASKRINECDFKTILIYSDNELVYAAPPHKHGLLSPNVASTADRSCASDSNGLWRKYTHGRHTHADRQCCMPLQRPFEVIAQTTPCAIAIRFNGRQLSYGELDEQADELALFLQAGGLVPGSFCVIGLEPSLAQVRVILAVLKAGAVCLQFDPALPAGARVAALAMLEPAILFTRDGNGAQFPDWRMRAIHCTEEPNELPHGWPDEIPVDTVTPAYARATVSIDGALCISMRSHQALGACVATAHGNSPAFAADADPAVLWRPLSLGASLTIGACPS